MKRIKQKYCQYFEQNVDIENQLDKVKGKLNLVKTNKQKIWFHRPILASSLILILLLSLSFIFFFTKSPLSEAIPTARLTIDVNPSIELVIDQNNLVLSVSGLNDDGKIVIFDEEIVGLDLSKALEKIIELETKLGYLLTSNVSQEDSLITITVGTNDEVIKENIKAMVTKTINAVCKKLNIKENVQFIKEKTKEELVKLVLKFDPSLSIDDVNGLSYHELLKLLIEARKETARLATIELEELYYQLKAYEFKLIENEQIQNVINKLDTSYQTIISNFTESFDNFKDALNKLENAITEESSNNDYQKFLEVFNNIKDEIKRITDLIENTPFDGLKNILLSYLDELIQELEEKAATINDLKTIIFDVITKALDKVNSYLTEIESLKATFPLELTTTINDHLLEVENEINNQKAKFFASFEEKYFDEIERAINLLLRKKA